jgi:hypothetical protein
MLGTPECDMVGNESHDSDYRVVLRKDEDENIYDLCIEHAISALETWIQYEPYSWDELRVMRYQAESGPA